jgi:hypothetical protein
MSSRNERSASKEPRAGGKTKKKRAMRQNTTGRPRRSPHKREARVIATSGHHGRTVSLLPRDGYPTQLQAQWKDPQTRRRVRRTVSGERLASDGTTTDKVQATRLQQLAAILHRRLEHGHAMPGDQGGPSWDALIREATPRRKDEPDRAPEGALTVRDALAKAFGPSFAKERNAKGRISGRYVRRIKGKPSSGLAVSTWTEHARELRRIADLVEELLGSDARWDSSERTYIRLRDALIARVVKITGNMSAPRRMGRVHKALQLYIRATRLVAKAYAEDDSVDPKPKPLTMERWRKDLRAAWTAADLLMPDEEQARYERAEAGKIYVEGTSGRHDSRYALWLLLGMEGRPKQILRARRSHLEDRMAGTPRGRFRGPGTELKHGLTYGPAPAHRLMIDRHLRQGYLREYEERYQRREIADYPLFPSGYLTEGVAVYRADVKPWGYRQFLGDPATGTGYYAIERAAGVRNKSGRGPYALKYTIADLAPIVAGRLHIGDAVAVNLVTGHDTPGTATQYRAKVRGNPSVLVTVGRIIWAIRQDLTEAAFETVVESEVGGGESMTDYSVNYDGISITTLSGKRLWVPWSALTLAGQDRDAVRILAETRGNFPIKIDDDARILLFPELRVVVDLDLLIRRATENVEGHTHDAVLLESPEDQR